MEETKKDDIIEKTEKTKISTDILQGIQMRDGLLQQKQFELQMLSNERILFIKNILEKHGLDTKKNYCINNGTFEEIK